MTPHSGTTATAEAPRARHERRRPSIALLVRLFIADYVRTGANLVFLVLVPTVFVLVAAGSIADAARLLGGPGGPAVETNTVGWAAGFLTGVAMYFQVAAGRDTDRRMVLAGLPAGRLVLARLATGVLIGLVVALVALLALALRTGIEEPGRLVAGTLMFAAVYLAIGAATGTLVRDPVNGTVVVLFVFIVDVFFGPTMAGTDRAITRVFPTHFISLWMVDLPSRHGGRLGDLGLALAWTALALALAYALVAARTRAAARSVPARPADSFHGQVVAGLLAGIRDYRRNSVLGALLVLVPAIFILLADAVTPDRPATLVLVEQGKRLTQVLSMTQAHAATMAPIAVASLAALAGLFVVLDSRAADQRLVLAGFRPGRLLAVRLALVGIAAVVVTAVSLAVAAAVFEARQPIAYAAANVLPAATYGLVGVVLGPLLGRVSGVFVAFLLPFLDLGIAQSAMLRPEPPTWAQVLPGYGGSRLLIDAAFTANFDAGGPLLVAGGWVVGLAALAALVLRRPAGRSAG